MDAKLSFLMLLIKITSEVLILDGSSVCGANVSSKMENLICSLHSFTSTSKLNYFYLQKTILRSVNVVLYSMAKLVSQSKLHTDCILKFSQFYRKNWIHTDM